MKIIIVLFSDILNTGFSLQISLHFKQFRICYDWKCDLDEKTITYNIAVSNGVYQRL